MSQMMESFLHSPGPELRARRIEFESAGAETPIGEPLMRDSQPLHSVRVRLDVCVGGASMTVGELLGARERQVMILDRTVDQPVDLLLEGKVVAKGELVAMDGAFALRIIELPVPLKL